MKHLIDEAKENKKEKENKKGKDLIDVVDDEGRPAISGQNGNDAAFGIACKLWRKSSDEQEVEKAFIHYNVTKCDPKFDENGMERILKSAKNAVKKENALGKYPIGRNSTQSAAQSKHTTHPQSAEIRTVQAPNSTWVSMAKRLLNACQDDYPTIEHNWLENTRSINANFAYGVGMGYCKGKNGSDYRLNGAKFGLSEEQTVTIFEGYTLPIINQNRELVGVMFVRPSQPKAWRYMIMAGSQLMPYGIEWLLYSRTEQRIVVIVEGTINYLSLLKTVGGHIRYGRKIVILGLPNANVYPDEATIGLIKPSDVVLTITDSDEAGQRCANKWGKAIDSRATCVNIKYPAQKTDVNDLLARYELWEWMHNKLAKLHEKKIL